MMESINEILGSISTAGWSYYRNVKPIPSDVLFSNSKALGFIEDYFKIAGKESVFDYFSHGHSRNIICSRASHTISTFILGLKIAECLGVDVTVRDSQNMDFRYKWFLSCLYHDIGYYFETISDPAWLALVANEGINALTQICNIEYLSNDIFKSYTRDQIDLYLRHRALGDSKTKGVIDHGIIGGLMIYDGLRKRFEKSWDHCTNRGTSTRESFNIRIHGKILHCSEKHFTYYADVANAVLSHNIWKSTLNEYYEAEGRDDEINNEKITYAKNQIAFLLCLADTIEPIKRGTDYAKSIQFGFEKDVISIIADPLTIETVYGRIDFESWLGVRVQKYMDKVIIAVEV